MADTARDDREQVAAWIADDVDPAAAAELQALLDAGDEAELADRFAAPLTFGTAGLRGPLRAGPNGMNRAVVRRAAAGLAALAARARPHAGSRSSSASTRGTDRPDFARDSAAIFAAAGFDARLLPRVLPTPVLAFAVQHLDAAAGVMVTASHNPPQDNGYKVYDADGAQIVPPADREIEAAIQAVGSTRDDPARRGRRSPCSDEEIVDAYVGAVAGLVADGPARAAHRAHRDARRRHRDRPRRVRRGRVRATSCRCPSRSGPIRTSRRCRSRIPRSPARSTWPSRWRAERDADLVHRQRPGRRPVRGRRARRPTAAWRMLRGDEVGVLLADALLRDGCARHVRDDDRVVVDARRAGRRGTASATPRR